MSVDVANEDVNSRRKVQYDSEDVWKARMNYKCQRLFTLCIKDNGIFSCIIFSRISLRS